MTTLVTNQIATLTRTADGTIRVGKTRVSLDSVVHHFKLGATAEEITQKFPAVRLSEIYAAISYYLDNRVEVESYLREQEKEENRIQAEIESAPEYKVKTGELRERLLARWTEKKELHK